MDGGALERWLDTVGASAAFAGLAALVGDAVVFVVDAAQRLIMWNEAAERILGYAAGDVLGRHCLTANRCQTCVQGCGLKTHGSIVDVPLTLYRADGGAVRLRKTARSFVDAAGRFLGGIEVLVPVGEAAVGPVSRAVAGVSEGVETFHGLASASPAMHRVFQVCRNVAETDANALIRGESGTGKDLIARALHAESARAGGPFVAVNCAALTPSLMESELFGHVRGAFTGAVRDREGIFEQASAGTLFLDEVAELPLELQAKLLRVLEERAVTPVGGARSRPVDVRVIAATHRSLRDQVAAGAFREDLMYRLRVVPIFLPALRERREDVDVLLRRFIGERNVVGPRVVDTISAPAMRALLDHDWPGNVRELRNVVEYAFAVGRGPEMRLEDLPVELRAPRPEVAPGLAPVHDPDAQERARILAALDASGGHVGAAAELLGVSRPTLWRHRKRLGLLD